MFHAIHAFFSIRILFIRIIRLRSGNNKNNLIIIKAQIIGSIEYYIVDLGKYHIAFEDGSEDYIAPSEIDNVEVMVI